MTSPVVHQLLKNIAIADANKAGVLSRLQAERQQLYDTHLKAIDEQIAELATAPDRLRDEARSIIRDMVLNGEDVEHERVTVRQSQRYVYDDDDVLAWCRENAPELVRIKESIDKRAFVKDAANRCPLAERVNDIEIAIPKGLADMVYGEAHDDH